MKKTSKKVATQASEILRQKKSSIVSKTLSASALAQVSEGKETSEQVSKLASKVDT